MHRHKQRPRVIMFVLPYMVETDAEGAKIRSFHAFPYGVLSIVTHCQRANDFMVVDLNLPGFSISPNKAVEHYVRNMKPDFVGFSMMFDNSYQHLPQLLQTVKDINPDIITLLGGAAASYSYTEILDEQEDLDAVCFGEGEQPMADLLNASAPHHWLQAHPSWVTKKKIKTDPLFQPGSYTIDIDQLIDIDYSYVNINDYRMKQAFSPSITHQDMKQFFVMTSRGCPFQCTFCNNAKLHGRKVRYASVDTIIDHVQYLVEKEKMEVLTLYDDQLLMDTDRAKELFRRLAVFDLRIECPNGLSVAFIDEELAELMRLAGMDTVYLAIESGSEYVLHELIKKPLKLEQVQPVVDMLRKHNFYIHGFFVMGMPGETTEHRRETMKFLNRIQLDWAGFNMATPVRGSALYDQCIQNGWIKPQKIQDIVDKKYIINVPGTDPEQVEEEVYLMNLQYNFVNNRRMKQGDYLTAMRSFQEVLSRYNKHAFAYYYLSECKHKLYGTGNAERGHFADILAVDPKWKKYADKLIFIPQIHERW